MDHGLEKVESIAQIVEKYFEGKAVRLIRGRNWYKVVGVEFDEQVGCITLILEGWKPLLLWWNEKYVIAEIREVKPEPRHVTWQVESFRPGDRRK